MVVPRLVRAPGFFVHLIHTGLEFFFDDFPGLGVNQGLIFLHDGGALGAELVQVLQLDSLPGGPVKAVFLFFCLVPL